MGFFATGSVKGYLFFPRCIVSGRKVTAPVLMSCVPPIIPMDPLSMRSFSIELLSIIDLTVLFTLIIATFSTNSLFDELRLSLMVSSSSTAGLILESREVRFPISTWSQAPFTAPHFVWPSTTIIFEPATLHPNSILPRMSSLIILPAMRTLKTSPSPWSKINSAGRTTVNAA
jgi:hypothetical protein